MAQTGLFDPLVADPVVKVIATADRAQFRITWPTQAGALGYKVFGGFDPCFIRSLISGSALLPADTTEFVFDAPAFPPGQIIYFWVASQNAAGALTFIDERGSYHLLTNQLSRFQPSPLSQETSDIYINPDDQQFFFEEIRRRAKAIVEDVSEEVSLFIKQWRGLPDPTAQDSLGLDPNHQAMTRDQNSFGSGFFPGYFPAIRLRMRFGALPVDLLDFQMPGLRPMLTNEAWSLWDPIMHENDLIVRASTGVRYVVNSRAFSNYRGVPIIQRLSLDVVTPNSPLQRITDPLVREKWGQVNAAAFLRAGFGVAADSSGGPNFLIL